MTHFHKKFLMSYFSFFAVLPHTGIFHYMSWLFQMLTFTVKICSKRTVKICTLGRQGTEQYWLFSLVSIYAFAQFFSMQIFRLIIKVQIVNRIQMCSQIKGKHLLINILFKVKKTPSKKFM